jgi:arylsulfatase A-like enzyme/Flp pilus assembly protein TadD
MGFLGSNRGLTPNLDKLGEQAVAFTHAYSQAPITTASHAVILTGTYSQFNHVDDFGMPLGENIPYLPAVLRSHGYRTAAFVASVVLDPNTGGAPGFDRGFDTYSAGFRSRHPGDDRYKTLERRGSEVVANALAWLQKRPAGPFFLWVHLYDAHSPYEPPEPYRSHHRTEPYDGEIAYDDACVGELLKQLRALGLYDDTLMAVMADHGEAFGEHGERYHGMFLYDETIHVPLLIKLPRQRLAGKRVDARVGLVDVAPTILQNVGMTIPAAMQGMSLLSAGHSGNDQNADEPAALLARQLYSETDYPQHAFGWAPLKSTRSDKYLFIETARPELYDRSSDPEALHDLEGTSKAVVDTLRAQLDEFRQKTASAGKASATLTAEQQQNLSALGYVSGGGAENATSDALPDAKDHIEIANQLHDGLLDMEETRYREAVPKLEHVLAENPDVSYVAYLALGTARTWLKEYSDAIPVLRKAIALHADSVIAHYALALSLTATGDWAGAVPEFQTAITKSPDWAELHFSLASAYGQMGRTDDARRELERTLELKPDDFRGNLVLGRLLALTGDPKAGLVRLKKAAEIKADSPDAHQFLADAYSALGREDEAQREAAVAERLKAEQTNLSPPAPQ